MGNSRLQTTSRTLQEGRARKRKERKEALSEEESAGILQVNVDVQDSERLCFGVARELSLFLSPQNDYKNILIKSKED